MSEKEIVTWSSNKEQIISNYIDKLLGILSINAQGEVTTTKTFYLDIYTKIITENVTINGITSDDLKYNLIRKAFFTRIKKYSLQNIFTFRKAVAAEARKYINRPKSNYNILLPFHIPRNQLGNSRSITILDKKLLFRSWNYVQKNYDWSTFNRRTAEQLRDQNFSYFPRFTPIIVKSVGQDSTEAFYASERPFDFLRWLINLIYQFGRVNTQWGGYPKPLGMVLPPPTYAIFKENGDFDQLFYTTVRYKTYQNNTLNNQALQDVRSLAKQLEISPNENATINILILALEKYGEALDTFEWRLAFLLLWQILELITLQNKKNINMKTVKDRIISLLGQSEIVKDLLAVVYDTRNSLVHRGYFPDDQGLREVNFLKYIAEMSINKLFSLLKICPCSNDLDKYYQTICLSNTELSDRKRIIQYIESHR